MSVEISGRNKLPGTVREIERGGPAAKVVLDVEGGKGGGPRHSGGRR